jgi:hypothetical protein
VSSLSTVARNPIKKVRGQDASIDTHTYHNGIRIPPNHTGGCYGVCRFGCAWLLCKGKKGTTGSEVDDNDNGGDDERGWREDMDTYSWLWPS